KFMRVLWRSGSVLGVDRTVRAQILELVHRRQIRERARHDDVGVRALPDRDGVAVAQQARHLALRVGAAGDRLDGVAVELRRTTAEALDGLRERRVGRVDDAVAGRVLLRLLVADADLQARLRRARRGRRRLEL